MADAFDWCMQKTQDLILSLDNYNKFQQVEKDKEYIEKHESLDESEDVVLKLKLERDIVEENTFDELEREICDTVFNLVRTSRVFKKNPKPVSIMDSEATGEEWTVVISEKEKDDWF